MFRPAARPLPRPALRLQFAKGRPKGVYRITDARGQTAATGEPLSVCRSSVFAIDKARQLPWPQQGPIPVLCHGRHRALRRCWRWWFITGQSVPLLGCHLSSRPS